MFKRFERQGQFLGYSWEDQYAYFFFGSRHLAKDDLPRHFPQFEFAFLKQVHGRVVVEAATEKAVEADGHYTFQPGRALISQSADCIPILLSGPGYVCALHAGWRGVALNIIAAANERLPALPFTAAIGPHIRRASFEIGRDVAQQLLDSLKPSPSQMDLVYPADQTEKVLFDLSALAKLQLQRTFGSSTILDTGDDTKTSGDFHSFRRDRERAGRQYSFVVLKG